MKKAILMVVFTLSFITANAQLSFTARAGANVSGIENSDSKMKIGWKVGAGTDYSFSKLFSLRPMLYFTSKGCSYGKNNLGFSPDKVTLLNYMELPLLASFHFGLGSDISLVASAGPYIGYWINKSPLQTEFNYKKIDSGGNVELDFIWKKIVIGVQAQYGISTLSKTPNGNLHNINYSLVLGYNF